MIGVFAAMIPEVAACFGAGAGREKDVIAGHAVERGEGFFVCRTGIGRAAGEVAEAVVAASSPSMVLSVGVCGGLSPDRGIGELVIASHVDHEEHRRSTEQQSVYSDAALVESALEAAADAGLPAIAGSCLTVDEAAWGPAEKAALHSWKAHEIVEMESFWIGRAAVRRGIPFLAARTVSDGADHTLFQTGAVNPDGTFNAGAFQDWVRANPHLVADYAAQAERARVALENLSRFTGRFLPMMSRAGALRGRKE